MSAGEIPRTIEENDKGHGILPPERFSSYSEVQTYCGQMIVADRKRSAWRAKIDGNLNGNQPVDPHALRGKNMGWYPNVNHRGLEGKVSKQFSIFYDLTTEVDKIIDIDLDYGSGQDTEDWAEGIEDAFTWLLMTRFRKEWNFHLTMQLREMIVHGIGAHVWPAPGNNWIPRTPKTGHILWPEETPFNFSQDGESFVLRDYVPLQTLYGYIRKESAATKLGWDVEKTWKAMALTSKSISSPDRMGGDLEAYQSNMKRGDLGFATARTSGIWLNWCYVRELDSQKKSLYIVPEGLDVGGYLFKRRRCFDNWPTELFPYDLGQGTLHSVRGDGAKNKDFYEVENRVTNMMLAQIILSSTVILQQTGAVDPDKLKLMKMGMMSILPQNLQIAQGVRFQDLGQGPLAFMQYLGGKQATNNEPFAGGTPEPKDRETGISFQMRMQDASQLAKGTHGQYCSNLRLLYDRVLRMVVKASKESDRGENTPEYVVLAKEFLKRCIRNRVPAEALNHIIQVREVTSTGAGSPGARMRAFEALLQSPVYANTSEDRKVNIERDYTASMFPGNKVNRFARSLKDNDLPTSDDSMIAVENNGLASGGSAVVSPTQNHSRHAPGHLQKAMEVVQAVQQGQMSPEEGLSILQAIGQHVQEHLAQLATNPGRKAEYEALRKELLSLGAIADKLKQQVEESAGAEPPQQQISDNLQIGLAKVSADHQVKEAKLESNNALQFRKQAFNERIKTATTVNDIARANSKHNTERRLALTTGNRKAA